MLVLGIETSCDETGVALYDGDSRRLLAHAVHSQVAMHEAYGGVVPELASRDHIRRLVPLTRRVLGEAGRTMQDLGGVGYTAGPGLAGALFVGGSFCPPPPPNPRTPGGRPPPPPGDLAPPRLLAPAAGAPVVRPPRLPRPPP